MPRFCALLNHRLLDVSSFLGAAERWLPEKMEDWKADQVHGRPGEIARRMLRYRRSSVQLRRVPRGDRKT